MIRLRYFSPENISKTQSIEDFLRHLNTLYQSTESFFLKRPVGKLAQAIKQLLAYLEITAEQMRDIIAEENIMEDKQSLLEQITVKLSNLLSTKNSIDELLNSCTVKNDEATISITNK